MKSKHWKTCIQIWALAGMVISCKGADFSGRSDATRSVKSQDTSKQPSTKDPKVNTPGAPQGNAGTEGGDSPSTKKGDSDLNGDSGQDSSQNRNKLEDGDGSVTSLEYCKRKATSNNLAWNDKMEKAFQGCHVELKNLDTFLKANPMAGVDGCTYGASAVSGGGPLRGVIFFYRTGDRWPGIPPSVLQSTTQLKVFSQNPPVILTPISAPCMQALSLLNP